MDAYADFIAEAAAGPFGPPPGGGWSAERIVAHVARDHEELIAVTEALLSGERPGSLRYGNGAACDERELDRYATAYGGLRGLADRVAETVVALREATGLARARGVIGAPIRIDDREGLGLGGAPPWEKVLESEETAHVPLHLGQLRALRMPPA
jgi:hypothetical protein